MNTDDIKESRREVTKIFLVGTVLGVSFGILSYFLWLVHPGLGVASLVATIMTCVGLFRGAIVKVSQYQDAVLWELRREIERAELLESKKSKEVRVERIEQLPLNLEIGEFIIGTWPFRNPEGFMAITNTRFLVFRYPPNRQYYEAKYVYPLGEVTQLQTDGKARRYFRINGKKFKKPKGKIGALYAALEDAVRKAGDKSEGIACSCGSCGKNIPEVGPANWVDQDPHGPTWQYYCNACSKTKEAAMVSATIERIDRWKRTAIDDPM